MSKFRIMHCIHPPPIYSVKVIKSIFSVHMSIVSVSCVPSVYTNFVQLLALIIETVSGKCVKDPFVVKRMVERKPKIKMCGGGIPKTGGRSAKK